jgi:hypothetical protein
MIRRRDPIFVSDARFSARVMGVLAVIFLLAQWGAQAHAYSHDHRVEVAVDIQQTHEGCALCESFAPLLAGVASTPIPLTVPLAPRTPNDDAVATSLCKTPPRLAFRSRAPPALT